MLVPNGMIYRCSIMENDEIKKNIKDVLQKGSIRPSSSTNGSSTILKQKKEGNSKLYIDYQRLNFNNIDFQFGYHYVPIKPSHVWKTSFKFFGVDKLPCNLHEIDG